jgi:hypothetical protein
MDDRMNEQQRVYYAQATTDYEMFRELSDKPVCHRLHYLQMCTEKLAKAYFKQNINTNVQASHAWFVPFMRAIQMDSRVRNSFGYRHDASFIGYIRSLMPLAYAVERMAPNLAGEGPNPEYPFPRSNPTIAPIEYDFQLWHDIQERAGKILLDFIRRAFERFPVWF